MLDEDGLTQLRAIIDRRLDEIHGSQNGCEREIRLVWERLLRAPVRGEDPSAELRAVIDRRLEEIHELRRGVSPQQATIWDRRAQEIDLLWHRFRQCVATRQDRRQ